MESEQPPQVEYGEIKYKKSFSVIGQNLYQQFLHRNLHVGVLGNIYTSNTGLAVESDLSSVTEHIAEALRLEGFRVTVFDMNRKHDTIDFLLDAPVDFVFNVCERINDNSLLEPHAASLLDILQIPYTGSNPQTLALCIDKIRVKKLLSYHGVPTPHFDYFYSMDDTMEEELKYPLIVKPANTDNSIGITNDSVVCNEKEMKKQLEKVIIGYNRPALIEEYIEGDEIDISIIGSENDKNLEVLPLSRSIFNTMPKGVWHIFPFEAKWGESSCSGDLAKVYDHITTERPAKISKKLEKYVKEIATHTYNILDCHDYGRVEVRVDKEGNPFVLELNPNPSINKGDCVPNSAEIIGMTYEKFIVRILELAIIRYIKNPPYFHLQVPDPGVRRKDNILKWLRFRFPTTPQAKLLHVLNSQN